MSTEYRRGIPSTAHVEAATRLGLLFDDDAPFATQARRQFSADDAGLSFRPIRPDGTLVDWEMLDQEVARVGQQQGQPATVTHTTAPEQPQGFRADLWQRIRVHLADGSGCGLPDVSSLDSMGFRVQSPFFDAEVLWPQGTNPANILARWAVYQELKPLYDLVDGAQGEAAMPRDVEAEWDRQAGADTSDQYGDLRLVRSSERLSVQLPRPTDLLSAGFLNLTDDPATGYHLSTLRNFAAVLDAVAERRLAERMRGQTPANPDAVLTVTSAQPEPRRFADVRPDRHGWRWWLTFPANANDGLSGRADFNRRIEIEAGNYRWLDESARHRDFGNLRAWNDRTVIPTDEQGNPVSWEAAGFAAEAVREAQESVQRAANDATPARSVGDIEWTATGQPLTRDMTVEPATGMVRSRHIVRMPTRALEMPVGTQSPTPAQSATEIPTSIPSRFALIEIDDADPTAERIRLEQEAERQRLAELRQRLVAERAAQPAKEVPTTTSRFDLIEPDPQADPAASIRAWEARQAAAKVRPTAAPPRIAKPATAPRRPAIEVVDAEVDGLSRSEVVTALVGWAFNGGC